MRPLLGKWLQQLQGDAARLKRTIEAAMEENPGDVTSWMAAAVKARAVNNPAQPNGNGHDPAAEHGWSEEDQFLLRIFGAAITDVMNYKLHGLWPEFLHGPKPDDPATKIDPVVLSRWGYADAGILADWKKRNMP
jgi:hypothetical protein